MGFVKPVFAGPPRHPHLGNFQSVAAPNIPLHINGNMRWGGFDKPAPIAVFP